MLNELKVPDEKGSFTPVDPNSLSRHEVKRIVRTFMFLTEKHNADGDFF